MRYRGAAAVVYVVLLTAFAYSSDEPIPDWVAFGVVVTAPFLLGLVIGRLWAILLPAIPILIALPAGYGSGELPIWFVMLLVGLYAVPVIVIGWGVRWVGVYLIRRSRAVRGSRRGSGTGLPAVSRR